MANIDVISAIKLGLLKHLEREMPSVESFVDDFPEANEILRFPSITAVTGSPRFQSVTPYVVSKSGPVSETDLRRKVVRVVGSYEVRMQLDIWVNFKARRVALYEELFRVLNPDIPTVGLTLKLKDYYDSFVQYHIEGFQFIDGESAAQRGEWRCKVDVIATGNHLIEKLENVVEVIESNVETVANDIQPDPSPSPISII